MPSQRLASEGVAFRFLSHLQDQNANAVHLVICDNLEHSFDTYENLLTLASSAPQSDGVRQQIPGLVHLPPIETDLYRHLNPTRNRLSQLFRGLYGLTQKPKMIVLPLESLFFKYPPAHLFQKKILTIKVGDLFEIADLKKQLLGLGYVPESICESPGDYVHRGEVLDLFCPLYQQAIRLNFYDIEIESIRFFNTETQLTSQKISEVTIIPNSFVDLSDEGKLNFKQNIKEYADNLGIRKNLRDELVSKVEDSIYFEGIEYFSSFFYAQKFLPLWNFFESKQLLQFHVISDSDGLASLTTKLEHFNKQLQEMATNNQMVPQISDLFFCDANSSTDLNLPSTSYEIPKALTTQNFPLSHNTQWHYYQEEAPPENTFSFEGIPHLRNQFQLAKDNPALLKQAWEQLLQKAMSENWCVVLDIESEIQQQRLSGILENFQITPVKVGPSLAEWSTRVLGNPEPLSFGFYFTYTGYHQGFWIPERKFLLLTSEDIFAHKNVRNTQRIKAPRSTKINSLSALEENDFIIHTEHGIGIYRKMVQLKIEEIEQEFLQLEFADKDKLFLPVYKLNLVQRYASAETPGVRLDKLGQQKWIMRKQGVQKDIEFLALKLLENEAKRKLRSAPTFTVQETEYKQFVSAFPYTETADQAKAIQEIINDMGSGKGMDRLVCGDVGFGKTEVALRAIFVAASGGKQVALLAPTTILAFQHYKTLLNRFKNSPYSVKLMNRFTSKSEQKEILADLKSGRLPIVVGTHRLLSQDINYFDLGLLVIDEEHRFGVKHKERIKMMKENVHVLTLTATPIPRTLYMALSGLKDISIINNPPLNRLPVKTFIHSYNTELVKEAVLKEHARDGQTFILYNSVQKIQGFYEELQQLLPEVSMRIAHGQTNDVLLEQTMLDFQNKKFEVLICTTIIESGLDIPNANTLLVVDAQDFGLSQLYQIRGRVGRSNRKAYAYLLTPPNRKITDQARKRLVTLEKYSQLGAGWFIANADLEMRGHGEILGDEQSGSMSSVGHEMYLQLLEETVRELRGEKLYHYPDTDIFLPFPAFIPSTYMNHMKERLDFYKSLAQAESLNEIDEVANICQDRFGTLPDPFKNLLVLMSVKYYARRMWAKQLRVSPEIQSMIIDFEVNPELPVDKLFKLAQKKDGPYKLLPNNKLKVTVRNATPENIIGSVSTLYQALIS